MRRPVNFNTYSNVSRIKNALFLILWTLSTQDLQYLHDLKNNVWNLDFVWVVIDEIIKARNDKQNNMMDHVVDALD